MMLRFSLIITSIFLGHLANSQNCYNNRIKLQKLNAGEEQKSFVFPGAKSSKSATLTISKTGDGPDLSAYDANAIWIGKNSFFYESSEILLTYSAPVHTTNFILSFFNNDATGNEEIENIRVFDEKEEDITSSCKIGWHTGAASGYTQSDHNATLYKKDTRSIYALQDKCCEQASGKISITSIIPFKKIIFTHRKISGTPNGVLLTGEFSFCVAEKTPPKSNAAPAKEVVEKTAVPTKEKKETTVLKKGKTIVLHNVFFRQGLAELLSESYPELDKLVALMREHKNMIIEVQGHTDIEGNPDDSLKLSEQRAEVVRNYLIKNKISASRIKAKGFGGTKPISPTKDVRNRRVEFLILKM